LSSEPFCDAFVFNVRVRLESEVQSGLNMKVENITILHGAGGTVMHDLVKNHVVKIISRQSVS